MQLAAAHLLSFDCYGTLIDWELGITETVAGLSAPHGVHPTEGEILALFAAHETKVQDANPAWTYPVILQETWRRMATSLGLPDTTTGPEQCEVDARTVGQHQTELTGAGCRLSRTPNTSSTRRNTRRGKPSTRRATTRRGRCSVTIA